MIQRKSSGSGSAPSRLLNRPIATILRDVDLSHASGPAPARTIGPVSDGSPKEACGVFGVRDNRQPVAHLTYLALYALQHRGQESAGIAVSDGTKILIDKDMGLVSAIFDEHRLRALPGRMAIGHVRYATTGASAWANAQPVSRSAAGVDFGLGHNGNLVNTVELTAALAATVPGERLDADSDSDVIAALLAEALTTGHHEDLAAAATAVLPRLQGAYSLVIMDETRLLASETPALDVVSATFVREIDPGELVVIDDTGVRSIQFAAQRPRALCSFEFVYIARPDGVLAGVGVHAARRRMGLALARQAPVDADLVMPIPDSSIPGAQGYAAASGIEYGDGLIKNRYIGRTFIAPTQALRESAVRIKFNPIVDMVAGQRLIVVEDSIVRATTLRGTMHMLREAGATEIHLRVLSPPYRWSCFYGLDTGDRSKLVAATMTIDQIRDHLGADSLAYLDLQHLEEAISPNPSGLCTACLTGDYPTPVPASRD
jgi:amidophosphoribosyltransferase